MKVRLIVLIAMPVLLVGRAGAIPIYGDGPLGDFEGTMTYTALSSTDATLQFMLTNTSDPANGGYLTAFVFNNPDDCISVASLVGAPSDNWGRLPDPDAKKPSKIVEAPPYGDFDFGASISDQFLGGGNPRDGLSVGETGLFVFGLSGIGLDLLDEWSFVNETSEMCGGPLPLHAVDEWSFVNNEDVAKQGEFFMARFRGFLNGGSNKTPGEVPPPSVPDKSPCPYVEIAVVFAAFLAVGWARTRLKASRVR